MNIFLQVIIQIIMLQLKAYHNKAISRRIILSSAYSVELFYVRCENIYSSPDVNHRDCCFKMSSRFIKPSLQYFILLTGKGKRTIKAETTCSILLI